MVVKTVLDDWEIPRVAVIESLEERAFVELPIPGRAGSLFQDMNRHPTQIGLTGSLYGEEFRSDFLEKVHEKFLNGQPVTFVADITTATELQYVIIERMYFQESGRRPDEIYYQIILRESPPPPPPGGFGVDTGLLDDAAGFLDTVTGALDVLDQLGSIPDIGDPTPPLNNALAEVQAATANLGAVFAPLESIFGTADDGG